MEVKLTLRDVFRFPRLRELADCIQSAQVGTFHAIEPAPVQASYPASSAQKRIYAAQQLSPSSTTYNVPTVLEVEGQVDLERLQRALIKLVVRHEALRTSFAWSGNELRQHIVEADRLLWRPERIDLHRHGYADLSEFLPTFIRPFDLHVAPLFRAAFVEDGPQRVYLLIDLHHIVCDGVSTGILYQDLVHLYQGDDLPEPRLQYKDYAVFERSWSAGEQYDRSRKYWLDRFAGSLPERELWTDELRPSVRSYEGRSISFEIDRELTDRLKKLAARHEATLFIILLSAYKVLLAKYSGQEDVVVGTPVAGRHHEDLQQIVGMFVNTLALRSQPRGDLTVSEFIQQVKTTVIESYEHGDFPLEELLEELQLSRDLSRHPLFDTLFVLQNTDMPPMELPGVTFRVVEWEWNHAKFDMTWGAREMDGQLIWTVEYATSLYREKTIRRMIDHFFVILQTFVEADDQLPLRRIDMLTAAEKNELASFAGVNVPYPKDESIPALFKRKAAEHPDPDRA